MFVSGFFEMILLGFVVASPCSFVVSCFDGTLGWCFFFGFESGFDQSSSHAFLAGMVLPPPGKVVTNAKGAVCIRQSWVAKVAPRKMKRQRRMSLSSSFKLVDT